RFSATVRSADGRALSGREVTWSSSNLSVATVNAQGVVTGVAEGVATIRATSEGQTGTASVTVIPASFSIHSGNHQNGLMLDTLAAPLAVLLLNGAGGPRAGVPVTFAVTSGGGSLSAGGVSTGADGIAMVRWRLGPTPGEQSVTVRTT